MPYASKEKSRACSEQRLFLDPMLVEVVVRSRPGQYYSSLELIRLGR